MERIEAEHPRPRHFLLHLSDPHLLGGPQPLHGVIDSEATCRQLFAEVLASGARPEAMIFTGDLADLGEPAAYAKLRAIVDPACRAMGAKVIWAMGSHDNRPISDPGSWTRRAMTRRWTTATSSTGCASLPWTPPCPASTTAS